MRLRHKLTHASRWTTYAWLILLLAVMIQVVKWRLLPVFIDIYYHLFTAAGFQEAGGWATHCFWEYAPVGRPQLYPPLLHMFILLGLKLGVPVLVVGKILQCILYPLFLFVVGAVIRKLFDSRLAFFTLLLLFSLYPLYLTVINTVAATLALLFCFVALLLLEENKGLAASFVLALAFYTHTLTSWFFLCACIVYGIVQKEKRRSCFRMCLLAIIAASPFIVYQLQNSCYFVFPRNLAENLWSELPVLHVFLAVGGFLACTAKKGRHFFFVALFLSATLLLCGGMVFRYFSFYGVISLVSMNAVFVNHVYGLLSGRWRKLYVSGIIVLFFVASPTLWINANPREERGGAWADNEASRDFIFKKGMLAVNIFDSSLSNFLFYCSRVQRTNEATIYYPRLFGAVVDCITANSNKDDIIWSNFSYTGGILGLLSQRATSSAMLSEVKSYYPFDQVAAARLIIWQKDPSDMKQEPVGLIQQYHLQKIATTELAFIYANPSGYSKKQTVSATISYKMIALLFLCVIILFLCSAKFSIDKNKFHVIL